MTIHPWNTYAVATTWSLRQAWYAFHQLDTRDDDAPGIRSVRVGTIGRASGHGDPAATAVLNRSAASASYTRTYNIVNENVGSAYWLVKSALRDRPPTPGSALERLAATLPDVDPATARDAGRHLNRADTALRQYLRLGYDHHDVPGNPRCPDCGHRTLRLWTSAPDRNDWAIVCTALTTPGAVPHIWAGNRAADLLPIGAAA